MNSQGQGSADVTFEDYRKGTASLTHVASLFDVAIRGITDYYDRPADGSHLPQQKSQEYLDAPIATRHGDFYKW